MRARSIKRFARVRTGLHNDALIRYYYRVIVTITVTSLLLLLL